MVQIRLVVNNEQALYSTFSPEDEFVEPVKTYIRSKIRGMDHSRRISLTVVSREPIDEERFRSAMSNWSKDEMALFRINHKDMIRMLIGTVVIGSILVLVNLHLKERFESVQYSLIPIIGALALGRAAGILAIDVPTNIVKKRLISEMRKNILITFEYGPGENEKGK